MSYASKQALIDRYGEDELIQLTDRAIPSTGAIDDAVLNAALDEADAEINGYLQSRYALPLSTVPLLIKKLAGELARFYLYDDNPTDPVIERHKAAIKTLELIARGTMHLGLDAAQQTTPATAMPETQADVAVFTPDTLAGYK